jgi:hypothetical protein
MTGWGGLPSTLHPAGHKQLQKELVKVSRHMERHRSPFHVPHMNFDRGWF